MAKRAALVILLIARVALADRDGDVKSRDTALALSIGGSIASVGLVVGGTAATERRAPQLGWAMIAASLLTPSLGEWYGGKYLTVGLGLRAVGAATAVFGVLGSYCNDASCSTDLGHTLIGLGVITAVSGIIYDIATARGTVDAFNARHRRVGLAPTVIAPPSGPVMGLGLAGDF